MYTLPLTDEKASKRNKGGRKTFRFSCGGQRPIHFGDGLYFVNETVISNDSLRVYREFNY